MAWKTGLGQDVAKMNVQITKAIKTETSTIVEATCEKVSGVVSISKYGLQVLCVNAMHRAWRGMGKHFPNAEKALAGYKSGEMKAIIQAAVDYATEQTMMALPVRRVSIRCKTNPEWGTFGVMEDRGSYYEIYSPAGLGGGRVLEKAEAVKFWEVATA